jgi:hypothetical protein
MSAMPQGPAGLGGLGGGADDGRLELSMAAIRSERRNRPRALPIMAALVLVAALGYLMWTSAARAAASSRLSRSSSQLASIEGVVAQLKGVQAQRGDPKYNPANDMVGRLQQFAVQVGLPRPQVQEKDPTTTAGVKGFTKKIYTTVINDADPALLLAWVTRSTDGENFPGLEIEQMKLTPGPTLEDGKVAWSLDIAFRRWERLP